MSVASTPTLAGRIAVVTGASSGIGAATAELLAERGAKVALIARRKDRLDEIAARITAAGGTALPIALDVTDNAAIVAAAERIQRELGNAGIVFNNAGVMLPAPIEELRTDQWQQQIDLNITAAMNVIGAFTPQLVAAAAEQGVADLVNTSSIAAKNIFVNFAVYSATKAYISQLTRHLRAELGAKKVRVSAIEPGLVATELENHVTDPGASSWLSGSKTQMQWLEAEDVAATVAFLTTLPPRVNLQQVTMMPTEQPM